MLSDFKSDFKSDFRTTIKKCSAFLLYFVFLTSSVAFSADDLKTVPMVDLSRYAGTWYQIARNPLFFERNCVCSRQVLSPLGGLEVGVFNSCNTKTIDGELQEIRGVAINDDPTTNAKFTVDFGLPNKGAYWIIGLDSAYRYAVVSDPSKKSLYILSKTPTLEPALIDEAVAKATEQVDTSKLQMTLQLGCKYPPSEAQILEALPGQPEDANDPGSAKYDYSVKFEKMNFDGRDVEVYLPAEMKSKNLRAPVLVFGHGQALDSQNYRTSFEHLAKKGIAVIYPTYDAGFLDRDWDRMAIDYNRLTAQAIQKLGDSVNPEQVVFSGHSKGGYVSLMSAGLAESDMKVRPKAVVVFAPAGYSEAHLKRITKTTPVSLIYSDADTIIKKELIQDIYNKLSVQKKQLITMVSYKGTSPSLDADHFLPLTKKSFFGGRDGASPFHFYGTWKFLISAVWDVQHQGRAEMPGLYGSDAEQTGLDRLHNQVQRNW